MPEVKEIKKEDIFKREIKTANPWFDPEFNKVEAFGGEPGFKVDDIPERLGLLHEKSPVSLLGKDFVKGSITSNEIADDAITSRKLFDKAVLNSKLHDACVSANKIADEAITEAKIAALAVSEAKIAVAAITEAKIAADAITTEKIANAAITASLIGDAYKILELVDSLPAAGTAGRIVFLTTDNKIYRDNGTAWKELILPSEIYKHIGGESASQIATAQIGDAQVEAGKIADGAIEEAKIAADAVTALKLNVAAIHGTTGAIASDHIIAGMLQTDCVTEAKVLADAITALKISVAGLDGVTGNVATNHIIAGMLQDNAVTEAKVLADAITATKINVSGLDGASGDVAANHIVAGMIQTNAITSIKILADAVTASKINVVGLDGATGRIIVADVTDADEVTAGVNTYATTLIAPGKVLISGAVNLDDWRHGTDATLIDGGKVYANSITATQIDALTITAAEIAANAITGVKIAADAVTAAKINVVGLDGATGRIVVVDATDANEVTAGINAHAVTLISAGKILISGAVNLDDWSHGTDATLIDGGKIYTGSITATQLSADSVNTDELVAGSVTSDIIATNTILVGNIAAGAIYGDVIATNAITAVKILAGAISTEKLAADCVTAPKINVVGLDGVTGRICVVDATDANEVTGGVNTHATTLIQAGKVLISGAVNLDDWRSGVDATYIDGGKIYAQSITATQILTGTITADEIHAGTITADELVLGQRQYWYSTLSTTTRNSNDTERYKVCTSYGKIKEVALNEVTGKMRISFEMMSPTGGSVYGRIYINGVAIGTQRVTTSQEYVEFAENFDPLDSGDLIQIYVKAASLGTYICNMRFQYDRAIWGLAGVELVAPLVTADQTVFSVLNQDP